MRGLRTRRSPKLVRRCLGRRSLLMPGTGWRLNRGRRRRRLLERDADEPLDDLAWVGDVDTKAREQANREPCLNDGDRGERRNALPRPYRFTLFGVGGHLPASTLNDNSSAGAR